jgi:succinate dehydrogenase flavin-adding protein (antitoxin of CptAB toxin-antitoxin module)
MKELDVLLERYLQRDFERASSAERSAFARLLDLQDEQLARYLLAGDPATDPQTAQLVERIRTA